MIFKETKTRNVEVLKEQECQISPKEKIEYSIKKDNIIAFDIIDDNKIIGFAMLRQYQKTKFFLWDFAIDYKYQNKGLGTKALNELIKFLQKNYNCSTLTTTYIFGNNTAKHLYEKIGFTETEVVDEEDIHEVNMILNL